MDIEIRSKWIPFFKSQQFPIGIFIALLGVGIIGYSVYKNKTFTHTVLTNNKHCDHSMELEQLDVHYIIPNNKTGATPSPRR